MRVELRTRDGELLGHLDLEVAPVVVQQALYHTQVVLGPTVDMDTAVVPVLADDTPAQPKTRRRRKARQA